MAKDGKNIKPQSVQIFQTMGVHWQFLGIAEDPSGEPPALRHVQQPALQQCSEKKCIIIWNSHPYILLPQTSYNSSTAFGPVMPMFPMSKKYCNNSLKLLTCLRITHLFTDRKKETYVKIDNINDQTGRLYPNAKLLTGRDHGSYFSTANIQEQAALKPILSAQGNFEPPSGYRVTQQASPCISTRIIKS